MTDYGCVLYDGPSQKQAKRRRVWAQQRVTVLVDFLLVYLFTEHLFIYFILTLETLVINPTKNYDHPEDNLLNVE